MPKSPVRKARPSKAIVWSCAWSDTACSREYCFPWSRLGGRCSPAPAWHAGQDRLPRATGRRSVVGFVFRATLARLRHLARISGGGRSTMTTLPDASFLIVAAWSSDSPGCVHPSIVTRSLRETTAVSFLRARPEIALPFHRPAAGRLHLLHGSCERRRRRRLTVKVFSASRPGFSSLRGGGGRSSSATAGFSCGSGGCGLNLPPVSRANQQIALAA